MTGVQTCALPILCFHTFLFYIKICIIFLLSAKNGIVQRLHPQNQHYTTFPLSAAEMLTAASGALVPMATVVSPTTSCGIANFKAIPDEPFTKKSAPLISIVNPTTNKNTCKTISVPSTSVLFPQELFTAPLPFRHSFHKTLLPFAISLNRTPKNSPAWRHICILPKKISKYSYIEQFSSSICKCSVITFFSLSISRRASVTA